MIKIRKLTMRIREKRARIFLKDQKIEDKLRDTSKLKAEGNQSCLNHPWQSLIAN